ncbi:hypothetical protein ACSS7Z_06970 [Microbacterium sp. A82]|uniref:hypothetical protein n=1 Tax=Microbacterium sp. A82 TaxID=3450452 RepID=UPI003F321140
MSGSVTITHGGAIAVDPEALRSVSRRLLAIVPTLIEASSAARTAYGHVLNMPGVRPRVNMDALWASADRAEAMSQQCQMAAENTLLMADVYELVELKAELAALEIREGAEAEAIMARIAELERSDPRVPDMEAWLLKGWDEGRYEGLLEQQTGLPFLDASLLFLLASRIGSSRMGVLRPGATLSGDAAPVTVTPVNTSSPIAPPTSLAEAFRRFPETKEAQFKVEKYTMVDGEERFVLYAEGTSALMGGNPLDMKSNVELYFGNESASHQASLDVLAAAGAKAGDRVDVYAHSQGAINAAYLATQSEFDVRVQVTAGSPVHPALEENQLLIELRHTDDLVSALAGGGGPGGTGSPDSFVASRIGDPAYHPHDLLMKTHYLDTYIETAEMVDASGDVRLDAIRENWRELNQAVSIESTEYVTSR